MEACFLYKIEEENLEFFLFITHSYEFTISYNSIKKIRIVGDKLTRLQGKLQNLEFIS